MRLVASAAFPTRGVLWCAAGTGQLADASAASDLPPPRRRLGRRRRRCTMVNEVTQGLFVRTIAGCRRLMLGTACVATLVSCGGGQGDGAAGSSSPVPATGTDSTAAAVTDSACDATITLAAPRNLGASNRIELSWQAQGVTSFSVLVRRAAGQAFEPVDAVVAGESAQFSRGAAYRLDFPTARVRVRGCNGAKQCVDSNEQPLLDALLGTVIELPPPNAGVDNVGSTVVLSS